MFRKAQDKSERKPWVSIKKTLQSRNVVAQHVRDEANVVTDETLEGEFMQEADDVSGPVVKR